MSSLEEKSQIQWKSMRVWEFWTLMGSERKPSVLKQRGRREIWFQWTKLKTSIFWSLGLKWMQTVCSGNDFRSSETLQKIPVGKHRLVQQPHLPSRRKPNLKARRTADGWTGSCQVRGHETGSLDGRKKKLKMFKYFCEC